MNYVLEMAEQSPQSVLLELSQILEEKAYALKSSSNATSWRRRAISSGTTSTTTTSATSDDEGTVSDLMSKFLHCINSLGSVRNHFLSLLISKY